MPSNGTPPNGTDDTTNRSDDAAGRQLSRRDLLNATKAAGAGAIITGVAGCSGLTSRRYEAAPVGLGENASDLGYGLQRADSTEISTQEAALGIDLEATLVNHYAAYHGPEATFALAALPAVAEGGQTLNPLADMPLAELPTAEQATPLLRQVDLAQSGSVDWEQGSEVLGRREVSLLDQSTEGAALVGRTSEQEALLLHLARVEHEGDIVFGVQADVRDLAADSEGSSGESRATQPLSGDGGVFPSETIERRWERFDDALDHGRRIDPPPLEVPVERCSTCSVEGVTITRPEDGDYGLGLTPEEYSWVSIGSNTPYVDITAAARVDGSCNVTLQWHYRRTTSGGTRFTCNTPLNTWIRAGTGVTPTIRLPQCRASGTTYDIRVQVVDSNGTVLASDTISYTAKIYGV
jgi:hypothetical protein